MGFPVKIVIFETEEIFNSKKDLAYELGIPIDTLKNYIYGNKAWNGLHFYSIGRDFNHCSICSELLTDKNYNGSIKKWKHGRCWNCEKTIRSNYTKKTKPQRRERNLNKLYGMDGTEYKDLLDNQNEVCAICGRKEKNTHSNYGVPKLCVDHNHKTGKVRGLLCNSCNTSIGKLLVDEHGTLLLKRAVEYIEENDG